MVSVLPQYPRLTITLSKKKQYNYIGYAIMYDNNVPSVIIIIVIIVQSVVILLIYQYLSDCLLANVRTCQTACHN